MPRKKQLKKKIADVFDIPPDVLWGLPRITLIGKAQLYIENHKGISLYEKDKICINSLEGKIIINGEEMSLRTVYTDDIYIEGIIKNIVVEGNAQ